MKQKNSKNFIAFVMAIAIIIAAMPAMSYTVLAAGNYTTPELARAVDHGFGAYRTDNPVVTYAEFMKMLDRAVQLIDETKLSEWQKKLPEVRKSNDKMKREHGMLAICYVAETLGGDYAELDPGFINRDGGYYEKMRDTMWNEFSRDYPLFPDWNQTNGLRGENGGHLDGGGLYAVTLSRYSEKPIFDYDPKKNSLRPGEDFRYKEALLAALRFYDYHPKGTDRQLTEQDEEILRKADNRRKSIRNSPTKVNVKGTKYYVSNKGDDTNDGLSPQTAWATPARANKATLNPGDGMFFERGSMWRREQIIAQTGVTYSAYGTGAKPIFSMSPENGADKSKWTLYYDKNGVKVWKFYKKMQDVGSMDFNNGEQWAHKAMHALAGGTLVSDEEYIGGTRVMLNDHSKPFDMIASLDRDLMLYSDDTDSAFDGSGNKFKRNVSLYLRCDKGNPGEVFNSIEFLSWGAQVIPAPETIYDNLCLLYTACHPIFAQRDSIVQNCEIGWVGGGIQAYGSVSYSDDSGMPIRFGSAISIGGMFDYFIADNNYIYQVYDEAITNQCGDIAFNEKTLFINNLIEYCTYGINVWIHVASERTHVKNVTIDNNIIMYTGYGFGHSYAMGGNNHIVDENFTGAITTFDYSNPIENFVISNNIFYISRGSLIYYSSDKKYQPKFSGNTYVQRNFANMFMYRTEPRREDNWVTFFYNTPNAKKYANEILGDKTAIVLPLSEKTVPSVSQTNINKGNSKAAEVKPQNGTVQVSTAQVSTGKSVTLTLPAGAKNAEWTSSEPYIVSVDKNGKVTGRRKGGTATITAKTSANVYVWDVQNTVTMRDMSAQKFVNDIKVGFNFISATWNIENANWHNSPDSAYPSSTFWISYAGLVDNYWINSPKLTVRKGYKADVSLPITPIKNPENTSNDAYENFQVGINDYKLKGRDGTVTIKLSNTKIITKSGKVYPLNNINGVHSVVLEKTDFGVMSHFGAENEMPPAKELEGATLKMNLEVVEAPAFLADPDDIDEWKEATASWRYVHDNLAYFDAMKASGFNGVRISITWFEHINNKTGIIDKDFLKKVDTLVGYITSLDMYCILDMGSDYSIWDFTPHGVWVGNHFENSWMLDKYKPFVDKRFADLRKQIANYFKDYDDHLIFQAWTEPMMPFDNNLFPNHEDYDKLCVRRINEMHDIFVKTVRSTGGNNEKRFLMIQGYTTGYPMDNRWSVDDLVIPNDKRLIYTLHCYPDANAKTWTPFKNWDSNDPNCTFLTDLAFSFIAELKKKTGIAVAITETGTTEYLSNAGRIELMKYFYGKAKSLGVPCFWFEHWEGVHHWAGNDLTHNWGLMYNMETKKWVHKDLLDVMMGIVYGKSEGTVKSNDESTDTVKESEKGKAVDKPFNAKANSFIKNVGDKSILWKRKSLDGIEFIEAYHDDGKEKPLMFIIHSGGGKKEDTLGAVDRYAHEGFYAITLDVAAHGESDRGPMVNVDAWVETVGYIDALIKYAGTLKQADASRFGIDGGSMGGTIALLYGVKGKYTPSVLLPEISSPDFTQILNGRANGITDHGKDSGVEPVTEKLTAKMKELSPINYVERFVNIPMYARFGGIDDGIESARLFISKLKKAGGKIQKLTVVEGYGHGGFPDDGGDDHSRDCCL